MQHGISFIALALVTAACAEDPSPDRTTTSLPGALVFEPDSVVFSSDGALPQGKVTTEVLIYNDGAGPVAIDRVAADPSAADTSVAGSLVWRFPSTLPLVIPAGESRGVSIDYTAGDTLAHDTHLVFEVTGMPVPSLTLPVRIEASASWVVATPSSLTFANRARRSSSSTPAEAK